MGVCVCVCVFEIMLEDMCIYVNMYVCEATRFGHGPEDMYACMGV